MARTKDPSAATKKAWETRKRNMEAAAGVQVRAQEGGGGEVVQQRGDFATDGGIRRAHPMAIRGLIKHSTGEFVNGLSEMEKLHQRKTSEALGKAAEALDIPDRAIDELAEVAVTADTEFAFHKVDGERRQVRELGDAPAGEYVGHALGVRINADYFADRSPRRVGKTMAHEIGHHAHLSKLSDSAVMEWAELSKGGSRCRISKYGRSNAAEHFAEVFSAYSNANAGPSAWVGGRLQEIVRALDVDEADGFDRATLKKLEPKAYAFMERLWRDQSMWMPKGRAKYDKWRKWR